MALEQCAPHRANARKLYWIRKLTPNLNIRDTPKYSRKWELLFRGGIHEPDNDRRSIEQKIAHIQHTLRTHATLPERLSLLHAAQKNVTSDTCNYLYQTASHNIRQATGLTLPQRLPMRIPQLRGIDARALRDQVARYISALPIPPALREYYSKRSLLLVCVISLCKTSCAHVAYKCPSRKCKHMRPCHVTVQQICNTLHCLPLMVILWSDVLSICGHYSEPKHLYCCMICGGKWYHHGTNVNPW